MKAVNQIKGVVAPMDRENIDTDAIMPKQFLKSTNKLGFGANLFDSWRFLDTGGPGQDPATRVENPDFVLNKPEFRHSTIIVARDNFGCGSSREHAPWGLLQHGIQAVIAPSFGDIFANNSLKNGLLVIRLEAVDVGRLIERAARPGGLELLIDLPAQKIEGEGISLSFNMDPFRKQCMLQGADDIALALGHAERIWSYEERAAKVRPWCFRPVVL